MRKILIRVNPKMWVSLIVLTCLLSAVVFIPLADTAQDRPDLNVKVKSFYPREIVQKTSNITIIFSRDMVPEDSLNILFADPPVRFDPYLSGLAKWIDKNKLRFYPNRKFKPSTQYTARIASNKTYLYGNRINEYKIYKFRTAPVTITNIKTETIHIQNPPFGSRLLIHFEFNYPIAISELLTNLSVTLKKDGRDFQFSSEQKEPSTSITIVSEPFDSEIVNGKYDLKINKGMNCVNGNIPLAFDYTKQLSITKPRPFVVNSISSRGAGKNCVIYISLTQPVALSEIENNIKITPGVKFSVDQRRRGIQLRGNFLPRETYTIEIAKGLRSLRGQFLKRAFSTKLKIADFRPAQRFVDDGDFISQKGRHLLEIETINIKEITVEVEQVYSNNIVYFLGEQWGRGPRGVRRIGRRIFHKDFIMADTINEPVRSSIDLGSIIGDSLQGIYNIRVRSKERSWNSVNRQVMITDLGILARKSNDYLMVWVNSLSNTKPVKGADVKLMSLNNQVIADGKTDKNGIVIFENLKERADDQVPFVITVSKRNDLSYLKFNNSRISISEFDISGRPLINEDYESFIYSDRDVYRPGEKLHLLTATRAGNGDPPLEFPYILQIKDPRGWDFAEFKLSTKNQGVSSVDYDIPPFAQTGKYVVLAKIGDDIIGRYVFQVEEFVPDRIKTSVTIDENIYNTNDQVSIRVSGKYLFGPACAGNSVNGHITIEPHRFSPKKWSSFNFGNSENKFAAIEVNLSDEKLDSEGNYSYEYKIPDGLNPPSSLKMLVSATVKEDGGRAISDYVEALISPYEIYLGVRRNFDSFVKVGEAANFSVIAVDFKGNHVTVDTAKVMLFRIIYHTILKKDTNGNYHYVSESEDQLIDSTLIEMNAGVVDIEFNTRTYGSYKVLVKSPATGHTATQSFYVSGWGYSPWSMANPDRIEMELDKEIYNVEDNAKLLIKAPFEGRLLLTIEKETVLVFKTYDIDSNTAEIILPLTDRFAPNVYVTATLIKSTTSLERHSPSRAYGMIPLMINQTKRKLNITLDAPKVTKPNRGIKIRLDSNAKKGALFTVALVDVGILQLTDFDTPDPFEFFYGKKSPALQPYDIYSLIFPDIEAAGTLLSPAGGVYRSERKRHLNPISARRIKPVALWSGIIEVDANGQGEIPVDIPQFNGQLRIMAVMFDGKRCGSASKEIVVRDKIVIQESLPRFISPGDQLKARFVVFNNTGNDDNITINLNVSDSLRIIETYEKTIFIEKDSRSDIIFDFNSPLKPGKLILKIDATNGTEYSSEKIELANRPGQPLLTEHGSGVVSDGRPSKITMPKKWLEGTAEYRLQISSLPAVKFKKSIQYLLRYPHGCIEQTTSKIMPLLYFNDLAKIVEPSIFGTKGHEYFIREGIAKICGMQKPSGGFAYWPGSERYYYWASVYASHCLIEARKAGYWVPDDVYNRMISYLQKHVREQNSEQSKVINRIYAAYTLALAGKLDKSVINNLKKLNIHELSLFSKFQLGAAIAMTIGPDEALWLMPVEIHPQKHISKTAGVFDSNIRTNAILIETLSEIDPNHPSLPALLENISDELTQGRWYTTQSNAFTLMAMGKYFSQQDIPDYTGTVVVDGVKYASLDTDDKILTIPPGNSGNIEISINGTGKCYYYWQVSGVSADGSVKEFDNRLWVRRNYLDTEGNPLPLEMISIGDQVVVKITAEALDKNLENVVINDLLPSCLEIENQRLETSSKLSWIPKSNFQVDYTDIRDDRLLLFLALNKKQQFTYYYSARVTSTGIFVIPPVAAECMYDPTIASAASSGHMKVFDE